MKDDALFEPSEQIADDVAYSGIADGNNPLTFVDDFTGEAEAAEVELPYWRCEYCNIHTPSASVQCATTKKWFCNYKAQGLPGLT